MPDPFLSAPCRLIVALDPSTDITGVVLIRFDHRGVPTVLAADSITAEAKHRDPLTERVGRIQETAEELGRWAEEHLLILPDEIAFERVFHRGADATEALMMATGAYLAVPAFAAVNRFRAIPTQTAIAVKQLTAIQRQKNHSSRQQRDKRTAIKYASVCWARRELGLMLPDDADAVADAGAVAVAAWRAWYAEWQASLAPRPLFGPGSRGPRSKSHEVSV
jgi:Holliday junction resolvasome RuvABC endonuclease subunit